MSTRSQKRRTNQQLSSEIVSETVSSPILVKNVESSNQDVLIAVHSSAKPPRIKISVLEGLRASLKGEITSEIRSLIAESQKELLKLLKSKSSESVREQEDNSLENEPREFYTPTRSVRISSTLNNDLNISRNTVHSQKLPELSISNLEKHCQRSSFNFVD